MAHWLETGVRLWVQMAGRSPCTDFTLSAQSESAHRLHIKHCNRQTSEGSLCWQNELLSGTSQFTGLMFNMKKKGNTFTALRELTLDPELMPTRSGPDQLGCFQFESALLL